MNYDINDFKKIWKDSDKESILNQFYNEHKELYEVYEVIKEVRKLVKTRTRLIPFNEDGEGGGLELVDYDIKDLLEILDKVSDKE